MDRHLTDIEVFEFANNLLEDQQAVQAIKTHISSCETCKKQVEQELVLASFTHDSLEVPIQIDVTQKVVQYFKQPKIQFSDNMWIVYVAFALLMLYIIGKGYLKLDGIQLPDLGLVTPMVAGVLSIFLFDLLYRFYKAKSADNS